MSRPLQPDKLIRDKVPRIMLEKGQPPATRFAIGDEYVRLLRDKLIEEAEEAFSAATSGELLEELADVTEVIISLAYAVGATPEDVNRLRRAKLAERGGFSAGIVWSDDGAPESAPGVKHRVNRA